MYVLWDEWATYTRTKLLNILWKYSQISGTSEARWLRCTFDRRYLFRNMQWCKHTFICVHDRSLLYWDLRGLYFPVRKSQFIFIFNPSANNKFILYIIYVWIHYTNDINANLFMCLFVCFRCENLCFYNFW